ncbi:hypothetical protein CJF32_00007901 [Rutstroemia sp. NJR-2017a WRK4]|nr:hypothetical protein CJF32_00007901 [Rutstroemia sp. NJR-2017a WRK4]
MLDCFASSNSQCDVQHKLRFYNAVHTNAIGSEDEASHLQVVAAIIGLVLVSEYWLTMWTSRKVLLLGLFSLGLFVILSAILNKYESFNDPFSVMWTYWYIREASTAIYVANIPTCWPLARRVFGLTSWSSSDETRSQTRTKPKSKSYVSAMRIEGTNSSRFPSRKEDKIHKTESMQNIFERSMNGKSDEAVGLEIWESREVTVSKGARIDLEERTLPRNEYVTQTIVTALGSISGSSSHSRSDSGSDHHHDPGHMV